MARRSDHSREELYELALEKAGEIAEKEGLRGLTARGVAREIGYTIGTLYNIFEDLDDLIVQLNGRTLDQLYEALAELPLDGESETAALTLAEGYIDFNSRHPKLWGLLFEHHLPEGKQLPDWHQEKILRLLGLVERALAPYFAPGEDSERLHAARVLWSSLHGVCSLASADKLASTESVRSMAKTLVTNYLSGLCHGISGSAVTGAKA